MSLAISDDPRLVALAVARAVADTINSQLGTRDGGERYLSEVVGPVATSALASIGKPAAENFLELVHREDSPERWSAFIRHKRLRATRWASPEFDTIPKAIDDWWALLSTPVDKCFKEKHPDLIVSAVWTLLNERLALSILTDPQPRSIERQAFRAAIWGFFRRDQGR